MTRRRATGQTTEDVNGAVLTASGRSQRPRVALQGTTAASESSTAVLGALSEREFQKHVVEGLKQRGFIVWTVPNMKLTTAGLPDVIAVHPDRAPLLFLELKTSKGRIRPAQAEAIRALQNIPGIYAAVVRPADWERLKEEV